MKEAPRRRCRKAGGRLFGYHCGDGGDGVVVVAVAAVDVVIVVIVVDCC